MGCYVVSSAPIPGWNCYRASTEGKITSMYKWRGKQYRDLEPTLRDGYEVVTINRYVNGIKETKFFGVHQLVLLTFVGPCPAGMECRHLDNNKRNNRLENLKWGTPKENGQDRVRSGASMRNRPRGSSHGNSKLTEDIVRRIRFTYETGKYNQVQLAKMYDTSPTQICYIVKRKTWAHVQ